MSEPTLSDVLNDLAGGRVASLAQAAAPAARRGETDIFMDMDGVLASLDRQYRYAKAQHKAARLAHGADSPMADIAGDMEDSAWCAMQTRLMELRADGAMMRAVQKKLREEAREEDEARRALKDKKALDFFNRMEALRLIKRNNTSSNIYEWLAFVIIMHQIVRLPFPALGVQAPQRMAA